MTLALSLLFDGARHDSGNLVSWSKGMIERHKSNRVDPRTKTLIFSDGLTVPRTVSLHRQFIGRCQLAFCMGTNLTNGLEPAPLQIVIKKTLFNGQHVAKLSDPPGKGICDGEKHRTYLRRVFQIEQPNSAN